MEIIETIPTFNGEKRYAIQVKIDEIFGMKVMKDIFIGKSIEECEEFIKNQGKKNEN